MSSAAGPSIATSGLVLDIDMSNTQKSWKGKPTTNLVITKVENYTGWGGAGWWMHPGNTTSLTSQILPDGNIGITLTATALTTGGLYGYNPYALGAAYVSGTQYTSSFWAKSYNGVASLNIRDADSGGALSTGVSGITDSWKRFSLTWTANASTNMLTFTGSNFSLYNVQLETNSFATPFVDGTRSNTQAIIDLTNNNTLTATSLTYASDGTFSFNGSNDKITLNTNTLISGTSPYTIDVAFKTSAASTDYIIGNYGTTAGAGAGLEYYVWQNKLNNYISGNTQSVTTLNINQWYIASVTRSGSTITHYLNGTADGSNTNASSISATNPFTIGNGHDYTSEAFGGTIGAIKVYNRALSAAEVKQNFNATRSRYGL